MNYSHLSTLGPYIIICNWQPRYSWLMSQTGFASRFLIRQERICYQRFIFFIAPSVIRRGREEQSIHKFPGKLETRDGRWGERMAVRDIIEGNVNAFKSCTSHEATISFAPAAMHDNGRTVHYPYEVICETGVLSHSRLKWAIFLWEIDISLQQ